MFFSKKKNPNFYQHCSTTEKHYHRSSFSSGFRAPPYLTCHFIFIEPIPTANHLSHLHPHAAVKRSWENPIRPHELFSPVLFKLERGLWDFLLEIFGNILSPKKKIKPNSPTRRHFNCWTFPKIHLVRRVATPFLRQGLTFQVPVLLPK